MVDGQHLGVLLVHVEEVDGVGRLVAVEDTFLGDEDLVAVADNPTDALNQVLARLELTQAGVITLYFGADTAQAEAEAVGTSIRERYPQLEVEVVRGSQPHYNYIVSVE